MYHLINADGVSSPGLLPFWLQEQKNQTCPVLCLLTVQWKKQRYEGNRYSDYEYGQTVLGAKQRGAWDLPSRWQGMSEEAS